VIWVCAVVATPQDFFSGISGAFNSLFGSNNNRRPPPRRPQTQFRQQQQQFQPQPQFQQPQQPVQQFVQQPVQPAAPQFRPQPSTSFVSQPVRSQPVQTRQPIVTNSVTGGTALCAASAPNHFWSDPRDNIRRGYVVTWKNGCSKFTQQDAKEYCNSMGMEPVSLDTPQKQDWFNQLIAQDAQRYFWTGGIVDHSQRTVFWSNGRANPVPFSASAHWSHTGGANLPQPDNRAAGENPPHQETCLAILNNFYADGIKWHDVACHHKKPTVCEPRS